MRLPLPLRPCDCSCARVLTEQIAGAARIASIALMLVANAAMLHLFVRGLHETDSLTATITSASVNFMLSVRTRACAQCCLKSHELVAYFINR